MTLYYDDNRGTDRFSLQDFEPSFGMKMNNAVREAWLESYGPVLTDRISLARRADGPKLSADDAAERIKSSGLKLDLSPKDNEYTQDQIEFLLERQRELTTIRDVRDRTPWDLGSPVRGLAMFGAGILDPLNLATAFVPWTRAIPAAQGMRAATLSSSAVTRTAGRAGVGAVDAGISTAVLEPFYYGLRQSLGDDYDAVDSMANIAFGTAFGGGVHTIGGAGLDLFRKAMGRELPSDAYKGLTVDEIQLVQGLRREIAEGMDPRDAQRVLDTYTPEMRRAAGFPDADDSLPAVIPPAGMVAGGPARVKIGEDYEPAEWAVVDADQLSATVDKADNQFRDRNRAAYQAEIQARANALDPAEVLSTDNPLMDVGPPTVAMDGTIIGGNGRTLFIQRAYEIGKGNEYREALVARLEALGIDPASVADMKKPVLVRRLTRQVDVKRAAMLSNEGGSSAMSPLEQAKVDAERLLDSRLVPDADGNLDTAANRAAIRRWVEQQPEGQRNALMTEDGMLSASGLARLRNAVLFQAYGDSPTLARLVEATDQGSRNVAAALARTAGRVADAEASIKRGELHNQSLADDVRMAVEQYDNLRRQGTKVDEYLAQVDAFGDPLTPEARLLLSAIGRNINSARRIGDVISGYYDRLQEAGNPGQGDMFGGSVVPDRLSMLDAAIRDAEGSVDTAAELTASVSPETREAALRAGVAQSAEGRVIDVDAIVNTDEAAGASTGTDQLNDAAARNRRPESVRAADFEASAAVDERNATAPRWEALNDAERAAADADAILRDTVQAGDQAFKYSRGEAPGQKKATLWQGTTARFAPEDGKPLGGFRWDFIGSDFGEQAQAFGYGHYLAQQAYISQTRYRERLLKQRAGKRDTYTIPDGVGGVLELSARNNDAAYVLADGTIVHLEQKDPRMAALARAAAQVDSYGYVRSKQAFEALVRMEREGLAKAQADFDRFVADNADDPGSARQINVLQRGLDRMQARVAEEEANLAALDDVTVEADLTVSEKNGKWYASWRDGQGLNMSPGFDSQADAAAVTALVLAPGIKKYEPPLAPELRERVTADGQEITGDLADFVRSVVANDQDGEFSTVLVETIGRELGVRGSELRGVNQRLLVDALLDAFDGGDPAADAIRPALDALRGLQERGVQFVEFERPGSLYRAEMDAEVFGKLMLWDEPLSAQPTIVREAFAKFGIESPEPPQWQQVGEGLWAVERPGYGRVTITEVKVPEFDTMLSDLGVKVRDAGEAAPARFEITWRDGSNIYYRSMDDVRAVLEDEWLKGANVFDGNNFVATGPRGEIFGVGSSLDDVKVSANESLGFRELTGSEAYNDLVQKINDDTGNDALFDAIMDAHFEIARRRFGRQADDATDPTEIMSDAGYQPRSDEVASVIMSDLGIPGHAFFDGDSRGATNARSYNIVIYSDDVARVVDRYARQTGEIGRATDTPEGLTEALRLSFGRSTEQLLEAGRVRVVASPADIPGGPHPADVKAATAPDGMVYIVAQNVSELEARGIMLHEVGVHVGMEQMLGPQVFGEVLSQLDDAIMRGESWAQAARAAVPADTLPMHVREEQLAYLVQNAPDLPIVQRIIAAVRAWAYRTFEAARERMTLTEADFRAMAVSALHHAARERSAPRQDMAPAFSRSGTDASGNGELFGALSHGTARGFGAFDPSRVGKRGAGYDHQGPGVYLTDDANGYARFFARAAAGKALDVDPDSNGVILSVRLAPSARILDMRSSDVDAEVRRLFDASVGDKAVGRQLSARVRELGFDGIAFTEPNAPDGWMVKPNATTVVVYDPSKAIVQSASEPATRYSRGETPEPKTEAEAELKRYDEAVKRAKDYARVLRAAADKLDNDAQATAAMREAMPDISAQEIDDLLAGLRQQVKGLRGMARTARTAVGAEDQAAALQSEAMRAADMLANNLEMAAVIEKRNAALNINARLKATAFVNQFRDKGLDFEGFAAMLVGSERVRIGSRVSIDGEYKGFRGEWVGGMLADVERLGLMREFISGAFDRDIYDALYRMGAGEKADLSGLSKQAVALAEVINKYQTDARNTRNRFGAWIRDLQGYITRQSHDMFKIRDATDAEWIAFVKDRIDLPKMIRLGLISEADPIASLRGMYDDFAAGVHMKAQAAEDDMVAFGRGSNIAKRESVSRSIYFKDGLAAYEYNERFGVGRLSESVLQGLDHAARSTALMKTLGTNPEATLTRLLDEYEATLAPYPERRSKFRAQRGALMNMMAQVDGSINMPGNVTAAKVGAFFRSWQNMARLGGALISSFSDLAGYAAELRYAQGKNMLSGVGDGIGRLIQGRAKDERAAIVSSLGVFHESVLGSIAARFDSPDLVHGKMAAAQQAFFRFNGLAWWTETLRDGAALTHSHYMATQAGRALDKIDPELRRMLQLYNIDAGKWDLLRMGQLQQADGNMYLTPEGLKTVPRAAFENYIMQVGRTVNDATVQNLMDDLAQVLRVMAVDRAHHAVLEPNARTRAWMLRGTKPGTVPGELLRFIGQFKSFSVAIQQMVLGREIYGRGYDTLGEYLKKGHGDMLGLAYMIGLYGALGYAAMSLKDLLKGRTPRDPLDPKTMAAALAQGGGLGLYGDFLFGEYNRMGRTFTASLAGPVLGNLDTAADLFTRMRNGDDMAAASFKALIDNTPFLNLYWARPVLDYMVLYQIQEALNPGFLRRMEKRIERDNGQTFLLPPSQVAR
jgi:hypothetical protein